MMTVLLAGAMAFSRQNPLERSFDLLLGVTGYETRASAIPRLLHAHCSRVALPGFDGKAVLAYQANSKFGSSIGADVRTVESATFEGYVYSLLQAICDERSNTTTSEPLSICIDVSSMSRTRIAGALVACAEFARHAELDVTLVYGAAQYQDPPVEDPWTAAGPVHPLFTGWSDDPASPVSLLLGLGYERERAVGAMEFLEPSIAWAFSPRGLDDRFKEAVSASNASLSLVEQLVDEIPYQIYDPMGIATGLDSMVSGLVRWSRPVIVPFGPKLFAAVAVVVALRHFPNVAVWRFTAGPAETPRDLKSSGEFAALFLEFRGSGATLSPAASKEGAAP